MLKSKLFTLKGAKQTEVTLPKEIGEKFSQSLLDQAVRVYEDGTHFGFAKVKTRSEVDLTKKKVYKQKGTGGARHGAKSAHIFVGGGVVHGPTGEKRILTLPAKMKKKALMGAISYMFKNGKAVLGEGLSSAKKTSEVAKFIAGIRKNLEVKSQILVVLSDEAVSALKFYKNIERVNVSLKKDLNAFKVLKGGLVIFDSSVFETKTSKNDKVETKTKKGNK